MSNFPTINYQVSDLNSVVSDLLTRVPKEVVEEAEKVGWEVYLVGGCIRNRLLGRSVGDLDLSIVGNAPELARAVGRKLRARKIAIYSRFHTALIETDQGKIELATARRESYAPDSRKPAVVEPTSIEEDLSRRDFTINAFAIGVVGKRKGEFLDLFGGLSDLESRLIRTPLDPEHTFSDDPLRMLRAVRFAAELGFEIESHTWIGIKQSAHRLHIVASERIGEEFRKMLEGPNPVRAMELLINSDLMDIIIPEVTAMMGVEQKGSHRHKDVLIHSLKVMHNVVSVTSDPILRLAALLHDVGKPLTKRFNPQEGWTFHGHEIVGARLAWRIGRRLHLGKEELRKLTTLVRLHMRPVNLVGEEVTDSAIRRLMVDVGPYLEDQMILCRADITTARAHLVATYLKNFEQIQQRMADVTARDKMRQFQSPIKGDEIMSICGIRPGPYIGVLKGRIEEAILDGLIPYEYDAAKEYLLKIKDQVLALDQQAALAEIRERSKARRSITRDFIFPNERD
ncbi:MAG: CCA tRNA nucleotidyltransferase [bacterium]